MREISKTHTVVQGMLSYEHIWKKAQINIPGSGQEPIYRYVTDVIIKKTDTVSLKKLKEAEDEAIKKTLVERWNGKMPSNYASPVKDGDIKKPDDPNYAGCMYFSCKSDKMPTVVDQNVQPILDPELVYSGCICNVAVNFFGVNKNGNRCISIGLNSVQLVKSGEHLNGMPSAKELFSTVPTEEDYLE